MKLWSKLCSLFQREKLDADMSEEMRLHLEQRTMRLKSAVLAPMPSASEKMATAVKPGLLRSVRIAYRKSCPSCSTHTPGRCARAISFACSTPPNFLNAV